MKQAKKRENKTKEQLLADLRKNKAFMDKMKFLKEHLYPAVIAASTSIEDAEMLLSGFNNQIMESFLGEMKTKTTKDLKLADKLEKGSVKYEEYKALVELFDEMSVFDAKDHIEGLRGEINLWKNEEMRSRDLSTLKASFIDEL